jgi:glyoxylase-like metal-dependent hydrolase (beta-lactamase superfamily II)
MGGMGTVRVGSESAGGVRVERLVSGDMGATGDTGDRGERNVWIVGDDEECLVIDVARDAGPVLEAVGKRRLTAVLCTHAHPDRIAAVPALLEARPRMRIALHHDDLAVWGGTHPDLPPSLGLSDGDIVTAGDIELTVLHTPGHTAGSCCFHAPDLGMLFSGDTEVSADARLLDLDPRTVVLPAHGPATTVGAEQGRQAR